MKQTNIPPLLVDEHAIAQALGMSLPYIRQDRIGKQVIPFVKIGRSVRYDLAQVRAALVQYEKGGAK